MRRCEYHQLTLLANLCICYSVYTDHLKVNICSLCAECRIFRRVSQNCEGRLLVSPCLSVCPSARMEQFGSNYTDFHEILYSSIFRKSARTIQVSLKSDNNGYFTLRPKYIYDHISLNYFSNEKCFRQNLQSKSKHTFCVQKIFSITAPCMR